MAKVKNFFKALGTPPTTDTSETPDGKGAGSQNQTPSQAAFGGDAYGTDWRAATRKEGPSDGGLA